MQVAAGQCHTLFISDGSRVYAAGSCEYGQFQPASSHGHPSNHSALVPAGHGSDHGGAGSRRRQPTCMLRMCVLLCWRFSFAPAAIWSIANALLAMCNMQQ